MKQSRCVMLFDADGRGSLYSLFGTSTLLLLLLSFSGSSFIHVLFIYFIFGHTMWHAKTLVS